MILFLADYLQIFLLYTTFLYFIQISSMEEIDEDFAKQKILQKILDHFQLEKPLMVDVSKKVLKNYDYNDNKNDEYDETKKYISFLEIPSNQINQQTITFKISKFLDNRILTEAFLKLDYHSRSKIDWNKKFNGEIYIVTSKNALLESIGNVTFENNPSSQGILSIPLNVNILSKILDFDHEDLSLFIKIHDKNEMDFSYLLNFASLKFHTFENKERKKRSTENLCQSKSSESSCCLRSLKINFDEIGWNFIISPKEINTNYCYGKCYNYKSDLLVGDAIYRLHTSNKKEHRSCCYPTQFRELNITIFKEGSFIETKIINDILIKKCSCY